ncbi:MAG: hypothetical protein WC564_05480 [Patescibacteria group bacterium]|jgi:hypothetical protein
MSKEELKTTSEKIDTPYDLRLLLEKNLEISQKNLELSENILTRVKYVKRYIFWKQVFSVAVWVLIILSTVVSFIYLPPLIKGLQNQVQSMIGGTTSGLSGF